MSEVRQSENGGAERPSGGEQAEGTSGLGHGAVFLGRGPEVALYDGEKDYLIGWAKGPLYMEEGDFELLALPLVHVSQPGMLSIFAKGLKNTFEHLYVELNHGQVQESGWRPGLGFATIFEDGRPAIRELVLYRGEEPKPSILVKKARALLTRK